MKVWLIRLNIAVTLDRCASVCFSESALFVSLARWTHPRHRPASWHAQRGAICSEPGAVARRRLADDLVERPAERAQAVEGHVETDLGDRTVCLAQQLHCPFHPAAL